eukprot:Lankesteria_metandrocarpae@DN5339_c0_g2_i6.p1
MYRQQNKKYKNAVECATCASFCELGSTKQKQFCNDILELVDEDNCRNGAASALQMHLKTKLQAQDAEAQMMVLYVLRQLMLKGSLFIRQTLASKELLHALRRVLHRPALKTQVESEILNLLRSWFDFLGDDADLFPSLADMRNELKSEGVIFKVRREELHEKTHASGISQHIRKQVTDMKANATTARLLKAHQLKDDKMYKVQLNRLENDLSELQQLINSESCGDTLSILLEAASYMNQIIKTLRCREQTAPAPMRDIMESSRTRQRIPEQGIVHRFDNR